MSSGPKRVDVAILGGGAAGLAAAREARRRGASAAIVSDGPLGGDCTFTGCVPSKTLIESARAGLSFDEGLGRVRETVDRIASTESADVLRREGVSVIEGEGLLTSDGRIGVNGSAIEAKGVVLALGSRPFVPPIEGIETVEPLTSDTLWALSETPRSVLIVGGGAIGCELGQALALFGVTVTIVEMLDHLLATEEPSASAIVERALVADGVDVRVGVSVTSVERCPSPSAPTVVATLSDGSTVAVEQLLLAVGRTPSSDRAGLDAAGVKLDRRGFVAVEDDLSTSRPGVYAAGDITGLAMFSHAADHMGRLCAGNILRRFGKAKFERSEIPAVTFTRPEVASVGLSEAEAAERFDDARVAELPLDQHDRALAAKRTDGYIKLVAGPNPIVGHAGGGRLVGATVVADRAGDVLGELALAIKVRAFVGRLATTVHAYPTWSYGVAKAAAQFFTEIDGRSARQARRLDDDP